MVGDLEWAVAQYAPSRKRTIYTNLWAYYEGNHPLAFATEKFRTVFFDVFHDFSENMCPAVVDALNDRLKVIGFRSSAAETKNEDVETPIPGAPPRKKVTTTDDEGSRAWNIWRENRLDLRSTEVHRESLLMGDAYVIVWPDFDMRPTIWPQLATEMTVEYDPNTLGKIIRAAKCWRDYTIKKWSLNIYTEDMIVKYVTRHKSEDRPTDAKQWVVVDAIPNAYGRVPVFHFPNQLEYKPGISELRDVIPLQDGLNKSVVDMMVAMEFASFKQRWAIGVDPEIDEATGEPVDQNVKNYGVDRMLNFPDPETKVGQFDATDLGQFLKVQDKFWLSVARVTGTPLHYFYITTGDFPSGEAIKSAEGRFIKRIADRQTSFGNVWEDVMLFAMGMDLEAETDEEMTLSTMWENATPRSESEFADTAVKKKAIGVPRSQLLREMGYTDEEIEQFLEEADSESMGQAQLQITQMQAKAEMDGGPAPVGESRDTTRARQGVPGGGR